MQYPPGESAKHQQPGGCQEQMPANNKPEDCFALNQVVHMTVSKKKCKKEAQQQCGPHRVRDKFSSKEKKEQNNDQGGNKCPKGQNWNHLAEIVG